MASLDLALLPLHVSARQHVAQRVQQIPHDRLSGETIKAQAYTFRIANRDERAMTETSYRILACDGGGISGVITAKLLQSLDRSAAGRRNSAAAQ